MLTLRPTNTANPPRAITHAKVRLGLAVYRQGDARIVGDKTKIALAAVRTAGETGPAAV